MSIDNIKCNSKILKSVWGGEGEITSNAAMLMPSYRDPNSSAQTAVTYRSCAKILFSPNASYEIAVLENITALGQKDRNKDGGVDGCSDTEYIIDDFKIHGWSAIASDLDAKDFGSPAVRLRTLFIGMKGVGKHVVDQLELDNVFVLISRRSASYA